MEVKLLEVRDAGTTIPVMATALIERGVEENWLLRRAGFGQHQIAHENSRIERYVILCKLVDVSAQYDPWSWNTPARTIPTAHRYIIENWDKLKSGDVVCVEHILGERSEPKVSERLAGSHR